MTKLYGKTAIVTGTSRPGGIGTAVCRTLAQEGANVFYTHLYDYDKTENPGDADKNWPDLFAEELAPMALRQRIWRSILPIPILQRNCLMHADRLSGCRPFSSTTLPTV